MSASDLASIVAHAQNYGFIYPSSEIYGGLQGVYDYGPHGVLVKRNLQNMWWKTMTQLESNIVGLDASILMEPRVWEASGHVKGFHDWMVDNKDSQKRYRVDQLLEAHGEKLQAEGNEEEARALLRAMSSALGQGNGEALGQLLRDYEIVCPHAKTGNWTAVRQFHLMFATQTGAISEKSQTIYLRPETAQGIFVNFLNVQKRTRQQVPFGIAQIGKAFRNELILRQFTFRMREFEQMEMQFFIPPGEEGKWMDHWLDKREAWYKWLGIPPTKLDLKPHADLAHYATAATDIRYHFPFGWQEVEGIHSRTDFDLQNHEKMAKKKLRYFDPQRNASYLPFVIETSAGCDRLLLMLLAEGLQEEEKRTYLRLPAALAPYQAAVLPLVSKGPLAEKAEKVYEELKYKHVVTSDRGGSIGKRYARQDLIGTPYAITLDHQTLEDNTVTLRERDTMAQQRIALDQLDRFLDEKTSLAALFRE